MTQARYSGYFTTYRVFSPSGVSLVIQDPHFLFDGQKLWFGATRYTVKKTHPDFARKETHIHLTRTISDKFISAWRHNGKVNQPLR